MPLLQAVLGRLAGMLAQGKALNLALTGILARMAECPHPLIHAYLFPAAALRGGTVPWPNLVSTLRKVVRVVPHDR